MEHELDDLGEEEYSIYLLNDFSQYPNDMNAQDRLVYQVLLYMHPEKNGVIQEFFNRLQAEIESSRSEVMFDEAISLLDIKSNFKQY